MKKTVFLILSVMAIFLSGCSGHGRGILKFGGVGNTQISTNTPNPLKSDNGHGFFLSITPRSSLSVNVEGILDYVQRSSQIYPDTGQPVPLSPWIRCNLLY